MRIMVYFLLWVMQGLYHQPSVVRNIDIDHLPKLAEGPHSLIRGYWALLVRVESISRRSRLRSQAVMSQWSRSMVGCHQELAGTIQ